MNPHGITLDKIIPLSLARLETEATVLDEVDAELFPFFEEEAKAELKSIELLLLNWNTATAPLKDLGRQYHTLKGAANSIGHVRIGALAGGMKDVIEQINPEHTVALKHDLIKTNIQVVETVRALLQEAKAPKFNPVKKEQIVLAVKAIARLWELELNLQKAA
jgi:chemosensory pili system protein ChpA (sensor histidine kinase/response regulator)